MSRRRTESRVGSLRGTGLRRFGRTLEALAGGALLFALGVGAHAEMYRCQGADGKTLFTSDRSQCPRAAQHETSGRIQRSGGAPAVPATRARGPSPARPAFGDAAEAQTWRAKRSNAEAALSQTTARLETLHEVASWCNRGHEVWAEDADGLRQGVDCRELKAQEKELRRAQKRLESYLDEGLEEECRRSGCLPGWIR